MRFLLYLIAGFFSPLLPGWSQTPERFVQASYEHFFTWFHLQSQVEALYADRATLYVFGHQAKVHSAPRRNAPVIAELPIGAPVQNIAYPEYELPEDEIDGYIDFWHHIRAVDAQGRALRGYLWGADIAKGWRWADLTGDGHPEFILLGIPARPRSQTTDINAELRIVHHNRLLLQQLVPGLCIFKACDTSPLLRIHRDPTQPEMTIVEASAMTIGCEVGIEKAFFFWNGRQLERVFHAEYTTHREFVHKDFSFPVQRSPEGVAVAFKVCRFSHEDENYNPVWTCRTVPADERPLPAATATAAQVRAR